MQAQTTILPRTSATKYEVREFRDVSYRIYRAELRILRLQLLLLQEWVVEQGERVAIVLEGRDAAGKGSTASGITHYLNPKFANVVEQGIPSARADAKLARNPLQPVAIALGSITIFDRSWYSRALIQPVMGYCTMRQYNYFMNRVNDWERAIIDEGVHLLKIYLSVSREAQDLRFKHTSEQCAPVLEVLIH